MMRIALAVSVVLSAIQSGYAQTPVTVRTEGCESSGAIMFDMCTSLLDFQIFWNYDTVSETIDMLFERTNDGGWTGLGFSRERPPSTFAMRSGNIVVGCTDFQNVGTATTTPASADYVTTRQGQPSDAQGNQDLRSYTTNRENGTCSVRFVRPFAPAGLPSEEDVSNGTVRLMVAYGAAQFQYHGGAQRAFADVDLRPAQVVNPPVTTTMEPASTSTEPAVTEPGMTNATETTAPEVSTEEPATPQPEPNCTARVALSPYTLAQFQEVCPSTLPGVWQDNVTCMATPPPPGTISCCTTECASRIQETYNAIGYDCCILMWLNDEFAGGGDHGTYNQDAYNNLLRPNVCPGGIDVTNVMRCPSSPFPPAPEPASTEGTAEPVGPQGPQDCAPIIANFTAQAPLANIAAACESGRLPMMGDTCSANCAAALQAVIAGLRYDCCIQALVEQLLGDAGNQSGMEAVNTIVNVCSLDFGMVQQCGGTPVETGPDSEEEPVVTQSPAQREACAARATAFQNENMIIGNPNSTCETSLPGDWQACDAACAASLQRAAEELTCCFYDFINLFAGPGDHGSYTRMGYDNAIARCNIPENLVALDGAACTQALGGESAGSALSASFTTSLALTVAAVVAWASL